MGSSADGITLGPRDPLGEAAWGCGRLRRRLGADRVSVWILNPLTNTVSPAVSDAASRFRRDVAYSRWMRTPISDFPAIDEVIRGQTGLVVPDPTADDRIPTDVVTDFSLESVRLEPLVADRPVGVLAIEPHDRPLTPELRDLVRLLALSVGHSAARRQAEKQREQAELLLELTEAAVRSDSLAATLGEICQRLARHTRMQRACLFLVRDGQLVPRMARYADGRRDPAEWELFRSSVDPLPLSELVLETGSPQVADSPASPLVRGWWADTFQFGSVLGVPIGTAPDVTGVLTLDDPDPRRFTPDEVRLVSAVGAHVEGTIARARAEEERAWHVRTLAAVRDLLQHSAVAASVADTGEALARVAAHALDAEDAAFVRHRHGLVEDVIGVGLSPSELRGIRQALVGTMIEDHPPWRDSLHGLHPTLLDAGEAPPVPGLQAATAGRACAVLPLVADGQPIGLVHASARNRRWGRHHRSLADQLTLEAQLVVDNAVLREKDQDRITELAHHATHDVLTGLPNRALFEDRVDQAVRQLARGDHQTALLFVDLDRFKRINDIIGHALADDLLVEVAHRLRSCVRDEDTVARFAGDEFVILLPHVDGPEDAEAAADRIRATLDGPLQVGESEVFVSVSIGIASTGPDVTDAARLLRAADAAMFRAKRTGRARHAVYDPEVDVLDEGIIGLEADLHYALERGQLSLRYQPIVDLDDQAPVAFEVLLRWKHHDHGPISPLDFIPLAEATGLIHPIGRWVIEQACQQLGRWRAEVPGASRLCVSVNLSPMQVHDPNLVAHVQAALEGAGVPPDGLILEITESSLMHEEEGLPALAALHRLGVRIAIDDFGIGYSALSYLQRFPIDVLKVDRSFVASLGHGPQASALARTVIAIAQTLGIPAIAEGVEDEVQLRELRDLGSDMAQGHHIALPLEADEVPGWIGARAVRGA